MIAYSSAARLACSSAHSGLVVGRSAAKAQGKSVRAIAEELEISVGSVHGPLKEPVAA